MGLFAFENAPFLDFNDPHEKTVMLQTVQSIRRHLGETYPLRIGEQSRPVHSTFPSVNPMEPNEVVGIMAQGQPSDVEEAVLTAERAYSSWSRIPVWDRAAVLLRAGHLLRQRRRQILAWIALEVGKNWSQADSEVAEAIDHFEWNAREILRWNEGRPIQPLTQEFNQYRYRSLGVGAVISPFNFPTTLPLGMIVAAIAAGNTVVFKPAEDASVIAHQLLNILDEAGLPRGVVNLVTGEGSVVGPALVTHPRIRFVAFVGSRLVGTQIHKSASGLLPGQVHLKRVMTEMGGKNATIVADDADLDWAAKEITAASFGYQGQKCSATSRVIAMRPTYQELLDRVVALAADLSSQYGLPENNALYGPVINQKALDKILR
jgi:1-pyrroline-5-carboxylate dehydrogenase